MSAADRHTHSPASRRRRWPSGPTRAVLLWGMLMAPLLLWGLPSSRHDDLLFGGRKPWPAERYGIASDLQHLRERDAGADTDLNPLADRDHIIDLTADDAARAEILRRYRLFSRQPDEMITLRALQRMDPRRLDFDPRLYQYGGAYIYLVGAALAAGALCGLVQITTDASVYLEHPESFAAFYVAARAVSLVFGALTLIAVGKLARRGGGRTAGWLAMLCLALTPVFITAVLEAKPHLPSACLILWAALSALDYYAKGQRRDALRLGWQAGGAFALVLTGIVATLFWPLLALLCPAGTRRRFMKHLSAAAGLALAVYAATSPYFLYNALANRAALASNIGNSTAMYRGQIQQAAAGATRIGQLLVEGAGPGVLMIGTIGLVLLFRRHPRRTSLAAGTGAAILLLAVLLGAGKPAEFARFLILPVTLLTVAAGWLLAALVRRRVVAGIVVTLIVFGTMRTGAYVRSFVTDARGLTESRAVAGRFLATQANAADAIGVLQEPAPYAVPPLDFNRRRILLLPAAQPAALDET